MTENKAREILDPNTREKALAPYAQDCSLRCAIVAEAMAVMGKHIPKEEAQSE